MKKVVGLAAAGLLAVSTANAGNFGTAHEDITFFGGISATWYNDKADFSISTLAFGLTKPVTAQSPVGFTLAIADFAVLLSNKDNEVLRNPFGGGDTHDFDLYLGYFSFMPVEGITLDAGLLWQAFGDAPVTILNPHITRPVAFVAQPVLFAGARVHFDLGNFKAYVGINDGSALGGAHGGSYKYEESGKIKDADVDNGYEAGVTGDLGGIKVGLHYFMNDDATKTLNATALGDLGGLQVGLEVNIINDIPQPYDKDTNSLLDEDDSLKSIALTTNFDLGSIKIPVRLEIVGGYWQANVLTITPTWHPTKNSYIRADIVLRAGDDAEDKHNLIGEFGYLF